MPRALVPLDRAWPARRQHAAAQGLAVQVLALRITRRGAVAVGQAGRGRCVDRGLSRNAVFRDRLGDIRSRRATVSSPLRHGALAYLTKKLASVSGHSRCGAVAQLAALAGGLLTPAGGSFNNRPALNGVGRMRGPGLPGVQLPTAGPEGVQ